MVLLYGTVAMLVLMTVHARKFPHPLSDEFIDQINSEQKTWTAGRNFPSNTPMIHIKALMGAALPDKNRWKMNYVTYNADDIANLPESFDPRDKWPNCPTLNEIRDQGSCGSCWAFGAVNAMTDRVCTQSNGKENFHFSAEDLMACSDCGGCEGGSPSCAWQFWEREGIVSGGNYNTSQGCKPYKIPPCQHFGPGNRTQCKGHAMPTPKCVRKCESSYNVDYKKDKRYGKSSYIVKSDEDQIKAELFKNGPVEAVFSVYSDYLSYKTGVYKNTKGKVIAGHDVKMLGWGVENGTKYWLIANSWNSDWGDKGFFKIVRGENHCNIEDYIVAGEPLLK